MRLWAASAREGVRFAEPETWGEPDAAATQATDRYGTTGRWHGTARTPARPPPRGKTHRAEQAHSRPSATRVRTSARALPCPARVPKPSRPGHQATGPKNKQPATRYGVGTTVTRPESIIEHDRAGP